MYNIGIDHVSILSRNQTIAAGIENTTVAGCTESDELPHENNTAVHSTFIPQINYSRGQLMPSR